MTIIKILNQLAHQPYFKFLIWSFVSFGFLLQSANAADTNDSIQLYSQFEGIGMTYAFAGNSEIVYDTERFDVQVCSKNNGAATSSGLLNPDGSNLTLAGDATIQAVYIQWYALTYNSDPDGSNLNNSNPLVNSISLTLPDGSANTVTGSKFYKETSFDSSNSSTREYEGYFANITSLVTAMPLNDVDGTYTVNIAGQNDASLPQFINACAFSEENARAWQMTVIYSTPSTITDSRKVYFHDGIQVFLDQTGVITPVSGYEVPSTGSTTGKLSVMTLQGDSAIFGETMTTSDALFPDMPGDFANSAGITSAKGVDAVTGGSFGGWDIDTLTGNFTAGSTSMNLVSGSVGDLIIITGAVLEIPSIPTCTAFSGEVTEVALPILAQLKTTDKLILPSKDVATSEGHLKAYPIDANGTPSTTASWDANVMTDRIGRLYSSDISGNKILFDSLDTAAFASASAASIKAATIAANLGGVSKGNNLDILSNDINTSLYLSNTAYRSYYSTSVSSRSQRVLLSSDDGFLYAFDTSSGALVWAWMPRSLVSELASGASFQGKHLMSGSVDVLDLPDSLGNYSTYIVGSYKSGLGHYVLKLAGNGDLSQVVWDDDQSAGFTESPNNGEMEFFRDGSGLVYASYVLTDSTLTSSVKIRSLVDSSKNDDITLSYQASSTPFMMQDFGRSNAPAKKTLYIGTSLGAIHTAEVIDSGGNFNSVASIQLSLDGSSVTTMDDSNTDPILYIDASVSAKDNKYYLSSQTTTRLTIHRYKSSDSSWNKAWTSYSSGAGSWDDAGAYSADNSGVPADQGGFAIIPPSGIQSLPVDAKVTDKAIIAGDTVILPLSVVDNSVGACYGKAYYYIYSLSDGKFPMGKVVMTDNTPVATNIALGYGDARQVSITNLAGTNKLIAYGIADKKVDLSSGIATTFVIKDPVTGGVRGWKEIGR